MTRPFRWKLADLAAVPKNGAKVLTTFSCGGGSTMGYKLEGFDVIGANDIDPVMAAHYQRNHKPKHYFLCPINELAPKLPAEFHGIDLLDGSPPCSSFSLAGSREKAWGKEKHFREGQAKQVLDDLFFDFLNLVEAIKPKIVIAENVKGMLVGNAQGYVRAVLARFKELGYSAQLFLINGADCELPQRRERVFFTAIRKEFGAPPLQLAPASPWRTVYEAFATVENTQEALDVARSGAGNIECIGDFWTQTMPGKSFAHASMKNGGNNSYFNWIKVNPNRPSSTVTGNWHTLLHWQERRRLTLDEVRVLSSFPDDYWTETDTIGGYMMGMSVPPYMAATVARAVREQWLPFIGLQTRSASPGAGEGEGEG